MLTVIGLNEQKMENIKILLGRGSPRSNIEAVEHWNQFLRCDKIIPKFTTEHKAYAQMRKYFLDHTEYTHLVLATDDIVVTPPHIEYLISDLTEQDYPVLSGIMNVDQKDQTYVNIAMELPIKDRNHRRYDWVTRKQLVDMPDIFKVAFSGFPLMAIRRDVVNKIMFDADRVFEGKPPHHGASLDTVFCWYCKERDIPIMVDQSISMTHLRRKGRMRTSKPDKLFFWPENGQETQIEP